MKINNNNKNDDDCDNDITHTNTYISIQTIGKLFYLSLCFDHN